MSQGRHQMRLPQPAPQGFQNQSVLRYTLSASGLSLESSKVAVAQRLSLIRSPDAPSLCEKSGLAAVFGACSLISLSISLYTYQHLSNQNLNNLVDHEVGKRNILVYLFIFPSMQVALAIAFTVQAIFSTTILPSMLERERRYRSAYPLLVELDMVGTLKIAAIIMIAAAIFLLGN